MDKYMIIIEFLQSHPDSSFGSIQQELWIWHATLSRHLKQLQQESKIIKSKHGRNTYYQVNPTNDIVSYLHQESFRRKPVVYNPDLLRWYDPTSESLLGSSYQEKILPMINQISTLSTIDYLSNRRWIETMLIDISYQSSKLEGNTYSYLDTEVLIKYHESASGKSELDTQMIINHKEVIEYCINNKNDITLDKKTFCEVHTLLGQWLLDDNDLWVFRQIPVQIWWSTYQPLEWWSLLLWEFSLFIDKLNQIVNPFEQSLFIMVFIPYFQAFLDINKRTSRICANIPLIKAWYPVISLLQASARDYIDAILAIYELNDISLMRNLFVTNYILNAHRYVSWEDLWKLRDL